MTAAAPRADQDTRPSPAPTIDVSPGSVVRVRDEDWLVTQVSTTSDGTLVTAQGLSELVRDTTAQFSAGIDRIVPSHGVIFDRKARKINDRSHPGAQDLRTFRFRAPALESRRPRALRDPIPRGPRSHTTASGPTRRGDDHG